MKRHAPVQTSIRRTAIQHTALFAAVLAFAVGLSSCNEISYRPSAIGKGGEIVVVADSALWNGAVGEALRQELGPDVATLPNPEPLFDLKHEVLSSQASFDRVSTRRNIVFAASLSDTTVEANFVRSVFSEDAQQAIENGDGVFVEREDTWRRNQRVMYLAAAGEDDLVDIVRESGSDMRSIFSDHERRLLEREMFDSGRQFEVEDTLLAHHDFRVKVQHGTVIKPRAIAGRLIDTPFRHCLLRSEQRVLY